MSFRDFQAFSFNWKLRFLLLPSVIPVNRQVRNIAIAPAASGGNLIDKEVEPMALESVNMQIQGPSRTPMVIPTFRLTQDKNGSILEEVPSMRATPVLKFLTVSQTQTERVETRGGAKPAKGEEPLGTGTGNGNEEEEEDNENDNDAEEVSDEEDPDSSEESESTFLGFLRLLEIFEILKIAEKMK